MADATRAEDKVTIFAEIEALPGGFDKLNEVVRREMRCWLANVSADLLERTSLTRKPLSWRRLMVGQTPGTAMIRMICPASFLLSSLISAQRPPSSPLSFCCSHPPVSTLYSLLFFWPGKSVKHSS